MTLLSDRFAALSDPTRLAIVERLMHEGELSAGQLVADAPISGAAVSRHLKVLRQAGLISQRINGNRRLYTVNPEGMAAISRWTQTQRAFWQGSLDRLEVAVALDQKETP